MITDQLRDICSNPIVQCGNGASESEIIRAEQALGLIFPEQFRVFLGAIGWISIDGDELYGLGPDIEEHLNLVKAIRIERNETEDPLPSRLLPIMNDGMGNHYCIVVEEQESKVVFWDYLLQEESEIEESDFVSWLASRVTLRSE